MKVITKRGRSRAFTLMELLISIGIVLTLVLLCLPVVHQIRDRALIPKCAGNLKNLGAGLSYYIVDNRHYPGAQPSPGSWWIQVVDDYASSGKESGLSALSDITKCPARARGTGTFGIGYGYNYGGFGFSENSSGGGVLPPDQMPPRYWKVTQAQVEQPSKTIVIGDGLDEPTEGNYTELFLYLSNYSVLAKRHGGGGNYLFADGHVEYLTPKALEQLFVEGNGKQPMFPY